MRKLLSAMALMGFTIAMAGCSQAAESEARVEDAEAPAEATPPASSQTPSAPGNCVIEADGRVWLDSPCEHAVNGPGSIILNSGAGETEDYAYLDRVSETQATGSWSGGGGAAHAHSPLGDLTRDGACWANDLVRIRLSPAAEAEFGVPPAQ